MKNNFLIIFLTCALFAGCEVRELTTYRDSTYISFANETTDSVDFSFMYYPGQTTVDYPVDMEIVGLALTKDGKYRIVVDEDASTVAAANYTIPETFTLAAGKYTDVAHIQLNSTSNLDNEKLRLVLRIEATSDLGVGKVEKATAIIWITNSVSRPVWWDNNEYSWMWLGTYSDAKYKLFIEVTGEYDLTGWSQSAIRDVCLKFKKYLLENPTRDEDGQWMEVPVTGLD